MPDRPLLAISPPKPEAAFAGPSREIRPQYPRGIRLVALSLLILFSVESSALQLDPLPPPLSQVALPATPGLTNGTHPIVVNRERALQLGKALFWDRAVGAEGVACATCHFHAGADRRTRHQLEPGSLAEKGGASRFDRTGSGQAGGVNYRMRPGDFPFYRFSRPDEKKSRRLFSTDDVMGSAGTALSRFDVTTGECMPTSDPLFHLGPHATRRVTARHAPTVINAVFNYRNFWDGRANNHFNGIDPYGPRNPAAMIWVATEEGGARPVRLDLENAALASQALSPPMSDREMGCREQGFPDLARRLLPLRPLAHQQVHPEDSVLGSLRHASGQGLDTRYRALIQISFAPRYWKGTGDFGKAADGTPYSMVEANFALFFGLALQLYEATLVSDATPFDTPRGADGFPIAFSEAEKRGHRLFNKAECDFCHQGPGLSAAHHPALLDSHRPGRSPKLVDRRVIDIDSASRKVRVGLLDQGFANTSVTPNEADPGLGGHDPWGNPLSFTEPYLLQLAAPDRSPLDSVVVDPARFALGYGVSFKADELSPAAKGATHQGPSRAKQIPTPATVRRELALPDQGRLAAAVQGAFKIPTLRNIELTGPYMHNGSMKSLEEVIEFYDRGGNLHNREHLGTFVFPQHFTDQEKGDLKAFLLTLTDERVRWERAPFDHPALEVVEGYRVARAGRPPEPILLRIDAVGRSGRTAEQGPLKPFIDYLQP